MDVGAMVDSDIDVGFGIGVGVTAQRGNLASVKAYIILGIRSHGCICSSLMGNDISHTL